MLRKSSLRVLVHVVQYFTREDSVTYRVVHSTRTLRGAAAERGGADLLLLRREPGNTKVYVKIPPIIPLLWRAPNHVAVQAVVYMTFFGNHSAQLRWCCRGGPDSIVVQQRSSYCHVVQDACVPRRRRANIQVVLGFR
jgi:hypothetical protein